MKLTAELVFKRMEQAIETIYEKAKTMPFEDEKFYACWLAQSHHYVKWTTRQLALASSRTEPGTEDVLHWRFIEEAKEEKRHEALIEVDIKNLGHKIEDYPELPHTAFFYQTLSYMIERTHPIAILGYALTLEGFAARRAEVMYEKAKVHGAKATTFLHLHVQVDKDHFDNALPHLKNCPEHLLPVVYRGVELCEAIYIGILTDVANSVK